ncbi:MAG: ABC transporter ATP-binding protein [Phycisphaerales bacterium]|nr:ABC transporter ATP-binding protein [Phycisphaerales bacterium]
MSDALLEVSELRCGYGQIEVLRGVSLRVAQGEIVALIGSNGAGKSTTLMAVNQVIKPMAGSIRFAGESLIGLRADEVVQRGLVQVPEGRRVFARMTVLENLVLGAYLRNDHDGIATDMHRVNDLFPVLKERQSQLAGTLSGGEQQMLAIGRALMSRPRLLMMDEPSMGIAPILVTRIFQAIQQLNQEGLTVLLVEQNARGALKLSSRGYVIETGKVTIEGPSHELLNDDRIRAAYLGD